MPPVGAITLEPTALQSPGEYLLGQEIPHAPVFHVPIATEGSHLFPLWLPHDSSPTHETPEPASLLLLGTGAASSSASRAAAVASPESACVTHADTQGYGLDG